MADMDAAEKARGFAAYGKQTLHNFVSAGMSDDAKAAFRAGDIEKLMPHLEKMVFDACGKTAMLFCGSPEGTMLRNVKTGQSATRVITSDGIPIWEFSGKAALETSHEPVLTPEEDWKCVYDPEKENH